MIAPRKKKKILTRLLFPSMYEKMIVHLLAHRHSFDVENKFKLAHGYQCPTTGNNPSFAASVIYRSGFFSSNGLLREVDEVNKMNDSLQSELEVSG